MKRICYALVAIALGLSAGAMGESQAVGAPATVDVLVVEATDAGTFRRTQLQNKFVPSKGTSMAGTGEFTFQSMGPTQLAAITCSQLSAFDLVYVPIVDFGTTASTNAIKNNPEFAECFSSGERAVVTGYHAEDHTQPATGQFLYDAMVWIDDGGQVGLLVLNDTRPKPQKYDFLQPMFPGVHNSVRTEVVALDNITFLTTPPHPIHANTSDGVQNLGKPTMDNWFNTCHTIWNTLGPGNGGYEDDGFIAVSDAAPAFSTTPRFVCALAKEGAKRADKEVLDVVLDEGSGYPDREGPPLELVSRDPSTRTSTYRMTVEVSTNPIISVVSLERNRGPDETDSDITFLASIDDGHPPAHVEGAYIRDAGSPKGPERDLLTCLGTFNPDNPLEQDLRPCPIEEKIPGDGLRNTVESDLHFQLFQERNAENRILRFFKLHCLVGGQHTITFYNKVEPKEPTRDPDTSNNWWRAILELTCVTPGKVTGGGYIDPATGELVGEATVDIVDGVSATIGGKGTFGFVIDFQSGAPAPTGNLLYDDHDADVHIKATSYDTLAIVCPHATFTGTARVNGMPGKKFQVDVDDIAEPGSEPGAGPDTFTIKLLDGSYMATGPLVGGNIQIHQPNC